MRPRQYFPVVDRDRTPRLPDVRGDILVVEDDAAIGEFIADLLADEGYRVRTARTNDQAHAAIDAQPPDLLLCDLHLPGESGLDLIATVRRNGLADVPIIVMTADAVAVRRGENDGSECYLSKPFDLNELLRCVATHIRPSAARQ